MKRVTVFYCSIIFLTIGCLLTGWGIGNLFEKKCEGILIGLGIGLLLSAITLFKIYKRLLTFDKKTI